MTDNKLEEEDVSPFFMLIGCLVHMNPFEGHGLMLSPSIMS